MGWLGILPQATLPQAINPEVPVPFELGAPFKPFQQLMGVLPPRSAHALPAGNTRRY